MKTQAIMGWHRYMVYTDDGRPACVIEMTPAISDDEKQEILQHLQGLHPEPQTVGEAVAWAYGLAPDLGEAP